MSLAVELVAWWCAAVGVWMVSLSAYSGQDLIVAAACGVPCAAAAVAARRAVRGAWRVPAELRWVAVLPWSIASDTVHVLALPWTPRRSTAGELREIDLGATGDGAAAAGRRALASVLISSTPGSYVVDVDTERGTAVVHSVSGTSRVERAVCR